jgi:hypothetical protein
MTTDARHVSQCAAVTAGSLVNGVSIGDHAAGIERYSAPPCAVALQANPTRRVMHRRGVAEAARSHSRGTSHDQPEECRSGDRAYGGTDQAWRSIIVDRFD